MGAIKRSAWALASLLVVCSFLGFATVRHVPSVYATIQAAIDAADPGDTIQVAAGTYTYGATLLIDKPLILRGNTRDDTLVQFDAAVSTAVRVRADDVTIERIHLRSQASSTSGDIYVIDIPFKAWGPHPSMPEEFYRDFTLRDATIEGARRSLWIHMENLTIENTRFLYNGNRQAIQIRSILGTSRITGNDFSGGASSGAAIIFEAGGTLWPLGGDLEISGNTVTRFSQFTLLNMGSMPNLTDLLIRDNVIDHQDRSGSSIIFVAPIDFSRYSSIEIVDNTFTNPNTGRLAVYVDYSYGGIGVPSNGQIKTGCNTFAVSTPWGKVDDTVHPDAPVGFSAGAPVGMSLAAFDVTCGPLPVQNITQGTEYATIQAGVDAANPGDEIHVSAGTYTETVALNKSLKLVGAGCGQTIWQGETITASSLVIARDNTVPANVHVEITGFSFETQQGNSIRASWSTSYAEALTLDIHHNCFKHVGPRQTATFGIYVNGANQTPRGSQGALRVYENLFDVVTGGVLFEYCRAVDVLDNTFNVTYEGVVFNYYGNNGALGEQLVRGNTFNHVPVSWAFAMNNWHGTGTYTVLPNVVEHNTFAGPGFAYSILYGVQASQAQPHDFTIRCNEILSGSIVLWGDYANQAPLDARCNWWGTVTGPTHASNPGGTGPSVPGNVLFSPWLVAYPSCIASGSGDANLDGVVDVRDVELLYAAVQGLVTLTAAQIAAGDMNGSGTITLEDAQLLALALITCPPGLPVCAQCCP